MTRTRQAAPLDLFDPGVVPVYEYRVQYRRRWSSRTQSRIFQTTWGVRLFLGKLRQERWDLEPITELHVQRRTVGEWESVDRRSSLLVTYHKKGHHR